MKFVVKKLETLLERMAWNLFRYIEPFRHGSWIPDHECARQTDGRTDSETEPPLGTALDAHYELTFALMSMIMMISSLSVWLSVVSRYWSVSMVVWLHLFSHWSVYRPSIYSCAVHFCLYCCPIISVRFVKKAVDGGRAPQARESRRRSAEEGGIWGGGVPLRTGELCPTQKIFDFFISK